MNIPNAGSTATSDRQLPNLGTLLEAKRSDVPFKLTRALLRSERGVRRFAGFAFGLAKRLQPLIDREFRNTALPDLLRDAIRDSALFDQLVHPEMEFHGGTLVATHLYDAVLNLDGAKTETLHLAATVTATFADLVVSMNELNIAAIRATALKTRTVLTVEGVEAITREADIGPYEYLFMPRIDPDPSATQRGIRTSPGTQ